MCIRDNEMIKLCLEKIFFMLARVSSEAELEVECAIKGIEQQALLDAATAFARSLWSGQWQDRAEKAEVTVKDFWRDRFSKGRHGANLKDLLDTIVFLVKSVELKLAITEEGCLFSA